MKTTAIILAAGRGTRMGGSIPKQYLLLNGKPVLYYTMEAFEKSAVDEILLVAGKDEVVRLRSGVMGKDGFSKIAGIVPGGAERYESVFQGLKKAAENPPQKVLIHDGARPLITQDVINRIIDILDHEDAVIAGMPVKDTIKLADEEGFIASTTNRNLTWAAQTPQAFRFDLIFSAYEQLLSWDGPQPVNVTDDAMVFQLAYPDKKVKLTEGGYQNIKITTPDDLAAAEQFLRG